MIKTLYKLGTSGKVQQWSIEIQGNQYRSIEGFVNGAMTTSEWTTAQPKNVGRSNETSGAVQAALEAEAKIKLKLNKGYIEDPSGVSRRRFEPMLAHEYKKEEHKIAKYKDRKFSQPKLDGMRCNITANSILSREGKPILAVPHILVELLNFFENNPNIVLDGELYNHNLKNDFNSLISHVRKQKPTAEDIEAAKIIEYHIYDMFDKDSPDKPFSVRSEFIKEELQGIPGIVIVRTDEILSQDQQDKIYADYLEQGYEGQMVRIDRPYEQKRSHFLLKRKEFQDKEYKVIDVREGVGNRSGMMGSMILQTEEGEQFESNALGGMDYYRELLANKAKYIGKMATIRFQNLTPRGVPRFPVMTTIRDYE